MDNDGQLILFDHIPDDILKTIFSFIDLHFIARRVDKRFHSLIPKNIFNTKKQYNNFCENIVQKVAEFGKKNMLKWLTDDGFKLKVTIYRFAARGDNLEIIRWLHENKYKLNKWISVVAALHGNFNLLKWLKNNGCPVDKDSAVTAIINGNLEMLKWIYENGCYPEITSWACAIKYGHLEILKYLFHKGLNDSWCHGCIRYATENNQLKVVQWMIDVKLDEHIDERIAAASAAARGWVNGIEGCTQIFLLFCQNKFPISEYAFNLINDNFAVDVEWLLENSCNVITGYTGYRPSRFDRLKINDNFKRIIAGKLD